MYAIQIHTGMPRGSNYYAGFSTSTGVVYRTTGHECRVWATAAEAREHQQQYDIGGKIVELEYRRLPSCPDMYAK